ncbi:MAG: cyclic nucleotide-binding domain-containing protein [Deltaproteobacteria bacterium]|nr:cyclic nucleotide-binding domain-containing protein [Deltaproteobacteria bacterium]
MVDAEEILGLPQFDGLDDEQLSLLAMLMQERELPGGEDAFAEGDPPSGLYILKTGKLDVRVRLGDGNREASVYVIKPVELFGEIAFVDDSPRTATVRAIEDSSVLFLSMESYADLVEENPEIDRIVMKNIAMTLADRLRSTDDKLRNLLASSKGMAPQIFTEIFSAT